MQQADIIMQQIVVTFMCRLYIHHNCQAPYCKANPAVSVLGWLSGLHDYMLTSVTQILVVLRNANIHHTTVFARSDAALD